MVFRLGEIAEKLGVRLEGDAAREIRGISTLQLAGENDISFLSNPKYKSQLKDTAAAAVIVHPDALALCDPSLNVLVSDNPYLSFAELTGLFSDLPDTEAGIHPSASVADTAVIDASACIAANVVIGEYVNIGPDTVVEANSVIADRCKIGNGCHLHANVVLYHNVKLGNQVSIHSGSVIGGDGFGFAPRKGAATKWQKIHQLGGVTIGNHVDIGANTCVDRGALEDTIIEDGVIIDNLVQIAHNCVIGENTAIAGCTGIAGSTSIGKGCTIAGAVSMSGHISLCDNVHVTMGTNVTKSISTPGSYSSGTAMMETSAWRRSAVRFTQLNQIEQRVKKLEKSDQNSSFSDE